MGRKLTIAEIREEVAQAQEWDDLSDLAQAYLSLQGVAEGNAAAVKGKGKLRHGPSVKCPDIYDALRREGKDKETAARISNRCYQKSDCNCH